MNETNAVINKLLNTSDSVFLIDEKTTDTFTYKELFQSASHIGGYLQSLGINRGESIVVMMDNSIMTAKIYFGCLYAGITVVPVNPSWTSEQVDFVIRDSHANYLLTTPQYKSVVKNSSITQIILTTEQELVAEVESTPFTKVEQYKPIDPAANLSADNVAIVIYTSGTTSQPKGVVHTVSDLVGNGSMFVKSMGVTPAAKFLNILPMTYLGGYYNLLLIPYLAGASVVVSGSFNASSIMRFWDTVIRHQVNTLWLVPTIMAILMEVDRNPAAQEYTKENINLAFVGTAPLPAKLKQDFENKYGFKVHENYGLSETLFISAHLPNTSAKGVGRILEQVKVEIRGPQDEKLEANEEGEVVVHTPFIMNGYVGLDDVFNKTRDHWFATGDIGYIDSDNNLYITGRKKDIIIKGGVNISPASIEDVIYKHDAVQECAVVGVTHALSGEEIVAVVKIKDSFDFNAIKKEIMQLCKASLSVAQMPSDIVMLEELPHTFTGKIQKAKLRAWLSEYRHELKTKSIKKKEASFYKPANVVGNAIQAISIAYNNKVYELQSKGIDVTVLSLGEAFFDLPLYDFTKLPFPASYHYSHSRGVPKLRNVLAEYFQNQYDVKFDPDKEIILTAGSKIAIYMTLLAIINPGDEVVLHEPAWVSYTEQIKLCHGIPVHVPYHESVFDFEKYITNRTKVLIVNNPNNPRGSVLTLEEIAHLYKLAEKYNLFILSDEAYSDFVLNKEQFISIGNFDKELKFSIICNSISKNFGISGWRIGYVIANKLLIEQILKLNQHLITCPATILEHYIADHYYDILKSTKPQINDLLVKRQHVIDYLTKIGLSCLDGDTTFYIFLSLGQTSLNSQEFCDRLLSEKHICVVPGIGYGYSCDNFVRVSIGAESLERIFSALDQIKALIEETTPTMIVDIAKKSAVATA